ncbi:MAG: NAD(P)-dependent oxidoreductase [Lachnospiraceae bacterium]|nr:NAD(P)-dependent oxidoreductase [Lachnospiraceae bacterium]
MDIVLTGSYNYVMKALILKLNKEGHRIFVISGSRFSQKKYPKVFEQYDFVYESSSMREIFDSIHPDAVVFLGAYDDTFNWKKQDLEQVRYNTGLTNILQAATALQKHVRFIYLSYQDVFSGHSPSDILEHDKFSAVGFQGMAVRQGELICGNFQKTNQFDSLVLRMDHLYGMPLSDKDLMEPFATMVREGLHGNTIHANRNNIYSMLHISDAVEYIHKVLTTEELKYHVYNLSSGEAMSEYEMAELVASGMGGGTSVEDRSVGNMYRLVLSKERFSDEFSSRVYNHAKDCIPKIAAEIASQEQKFFFFGGDKVSIWKRIWDKIALVLKIVLPYLETAALFIPFFMLNNRATNSEYFSNLDFYLLYVLTMSIIHGQQQALIAALLATAGYLFRQQYDRSGFDVLLDYNTYVWIAQLFILGLVVGHMKDRLRNVREEDLHEIDFLNTQISDITDINATNVHIKNIMEEQIVNQNDSFGKVYEITSSLDQYEPEEVLFYAGDVLKQLIHSEDIAIYNVANSDYARLFVSTSKKARSMGNSIEYPKLGALYDAISKDQIYINHDMNPDYPLMADAIYSGDHIELIIMIWGIPWDRMNLAQANMIRVAGYLIQNAVLRANRYMEALQEDRYIKGTNVLGRDAFLILMGAFLHARSKDLTECCVLHVLPVEGEDKNLVATTIEKQLRNTDYIGYGPEDELFVLLSNTNEDNVSFVMNRIKAAGYETEIWKEMNV